MGSVISFETKDPEPEYAGDGVVFINNGDIALIKMAEEPENGAIMLVRYGNESTLKRIRTLRGLVYLCREDGPEQRRPVTSDEYAIQGKLVTLQRKPKKR
jgi:SOS-response transcriptional repressor LexA